MKIIKWTCKMCGVRHIQTATENEKAVYGPDGKLLRAEPICGGRLSNLCGCDLANLCGYSPVIRETENGWEDVRNEENLCGNVH